MTPPAPRTVPNLAILLWQASADQPALCATPFIHAAAAAALDTRVEVHFAGPTVRLLVQGVAAAIKPWPGVETSLYDLMRQAANLDVRFVACAMAMNKLITNEETLIPEYAGTAGATAFVQHTLDPDWATLVY